jgi:hypothetical protein
LAGKKSQPSQSQQPASNGSSVDPGSGPFTTDDRGGQAPGPQATSTIRATITVSPATSSTIDVPTATSTIRLTISGPSVPTSTVGTIAFSA